MRGRTHDVIVHFDDGYGTPQSVSETASTACAIISGSVPLCIVRFGDEASPSISNAAYYRFPGMKQGYALPPGRAWPTSRRWAFTSGIVDGQHVLLYGRDTLIRHGWQLIHSLIDGPPQWESELLSEAKIKQSRDWVVDLLFRWRAGTIGYLDVAARALDALDSWVGRNLQQTASPSTNRRFSRDRYRSFGQVR
ncbi:hypothetical protein GCM10027169_24410 [Gordonia jinhuaensis]|uniref:Uncharacterized protein n=1 Tax=Gordonia jinhuaensis TaxID=1517702 RepID=A0A916TDX6_9ACTN|nr:hypothetical protein GCM10011489_29290 [Gordonia jinhuaensis]